VNASSASARSRVAAASKAAVSKADDKPLALVRSGGRRTPAAFCASRIVGSGFDLAKLFLFCFSHGQNRVVAPANLKAKES
jgi:hypothetical protein